MRSAAAPGRRSRRPGCPGTARPRRAARPRCARMSAVASARCWQPGSAVELQVLVDLRLALADRRFVERELDPVVAVGHHLAHQRRVFGGDVVADELGHVHESHDPVVEARPTRSSGRVRRCRRHGRAPGTAAAGHPPAGRASRCGRRSRAGRARCSGCGRSGCAGCARRWRSRPSGRCRTRRSRRAARPAPGALRAGVRDAPVDVADLHGQVDDAVAVLRGARPAAGCPAPPRPEHEPRRPGGQHEGDVVALAGLRAASRRPDPSPRPIWK